MNNRKEEIQKEIEKLKDNLNPYEEEYKVWNIEGTGFNNWYLLQLRKAELKGIEETEKEFADWLENHYNMRDTDIKLRIFRAKIKELRGEK